VPLVSQERMDSNGLYMAIQNSRIWRAANGLTSRPALITCGSVLAFCGQARATGADQDIRGRAGGTFTPQAQGVLVEAYHILQAVEPGILAELNTAVAAADLTISECNIPGFAGAADADSIQVKTTNANSVVVAGRILHEYYHWKYGANGELDPDEHAGAWAHTIWWMLRACWAGYPYSDSRFEGAKALYSGLVSASAGGVTVDPVTSQPWLFSPGMWEDCY
jgi:hypothetical protein